MPEGDTVYQAARRLNGVLTGRILTRWDLRVPAFATSDLVGERIDDVSSRGKHILHHVGEFTLHTHLKMEGSWNIYRTGERWRHPDWRIRAILETAEWSTVGVDLGIVELWPRDDEGLRLGYLGPDLLGPGWSATEAATRLGSDPARSTALALLDQRNLAGLGNEYVNEICFLRGIRPTTPIGETDVTALVALSHRVITANRDRPRRTTTGDTRAGRQRWVYGRAGRPCLRCRTLIQRGTLVVGEAQSRDSYWCPHCQPERASTLARE